MEKKVEFKVGNETLRGSLFIPEGNPSASQARALRAGGPFPAVIFFHGSGSKALKHFEAASKLPQKGIIGFCFNFRGCGISDGDYSVQTHQDALLDAKIAFDFLLSQNVDREKIGVVGGSFGGYCVTMLLNQMKIKSLVLQAPSACDHNLSDKIDVGGLENEIAYFNKRSNWENSPNFNKIADFRGSLLIIKSENDENVPPEVLDKYFENAANVSKKEMETILNADHGISQDGWKQEYFDLITNWFLETL